MRMHRQVEVINRLECEEGVGIGNKSAGAMLSNWMLLLCSCVPPNSENALRILKGHWSATWEEESSV